MVNRIRNTSFIPVGNGHTVGFVANAAEQIIADFGPGDRRIVQVGQGTQLADGAAVVLTAANSGATVRLDLLASSLTTLPKASVAGKGARFNFIVDALATTGAGHRINVAVGDGVGGAGLTYTDDADLLLAVATDALGDSVTVESDGVADWHIVAIKGTWSKV